MIEEYYDAGGDHAHTDLGLEKEAFAGAAFNAAKTIIPRLATHAGKAWGASKAVAPAAKAVPTGAMGRAWQATGGRVTGALGKAWRPTGGRVWNAGKTFAAPAGEAVERGVASGAGKVFGKPGSELASKLVKGVPGQAAKDAVIFGGASAGLEGGIGAYSAEEGDRLKAFGEGAAHGAMSGAAMGGLMGGFGKTFRNARSGSLQQAAGRQLAKPMMPVRPKGFVGPMQPLAGPQQSASAMAKSQMERGFGGSIKDVFSSGGGPINRATSAQNVAGGLGQFGAEWLAPMAVLPASMGGGNPFKAETWGFGGDPENQAAQDFSPETTARVQAMYQRQGRLPPATAKTAEAIPGVDLLGIEQEQIKTPARLLTTLGGGAATGIPVGMGIDALSKKPWYPAGGKGSLLSRTGQTVGTAAGILGGHYLGQRLFPHEKELENDIESKLEQIDFDKLMRYYKKREADQV